MTPMSVQLVVLWIIMIAVIATAPLVGVASAQSDDLVVPLDPRVAFDEARQAYSAGPWAERVVATVHLDDGTELEDSFLIRVDPAPEGSVGLLRLELGPLVLVADGERTVVEHALFRSAVVVIRPTGADPRESVRAVLPPIALPQLALLAGDTPFDHDLGPAERVRWTSAELSDATGRPLVTVTGFTDSGSAVLVFDAETGRLRSFSAPISADEPMRLDLIFRPTTPGDRDDWVIKTEGREIVESLAELPHDDASPRATED